jgi:hypothetical protein
MRSIREIGPILLVVALAAWVPSASHAELAKWDQQRVTSIAGELAQACDALYETFRKEPQSRIGVGRARDYHRLRQVVRRVKNEARHLSSSLAKGEGYDETLPVYESLMQMVRTARDLSRRTFTSNFVLEKAATAGDALRRIAPYYDPRALEGG